MTPAGDVPVSYLCPQCHKKLTARAADAGQRRQCPACGKTMKVPGSASAGKRPGEASPARPSSRTGGIANIPVVCPLCGTRMHATKDQIGQPIVCPDCLESVVVPAVTPPKPKPRPVADPDVPAAGRPGSPSSPAPPAEAADASDDDDDYKLGEPAELPRHRFVTKAMADLIDRHVETHQDPPPPPTPAPQPAAAPKQFAIKCPVCDTMLQATADEIGATRKCPDCYSTITVQSPRPKPRRVDEVRVADYDDDEYKLDEPVDLAVFRPSSKDVVARSISEEALQRARENQAKRERETPELPLKPLVTGIFSFLPDSIVITRIIINGALLGLCLWGSINVVRWTLSGNPVTSLAGLVGSIVLVLLVILAASFGSSSFLTILQESAEGNEQIQDWPENSLAEWITESFALLMAVFFASAPGGLIMMAWGGAGMPLATAWLFVGISLYVLFPIVQLSILETAALTNPISPPIMQSLREQFPLWATFYIMTFFLAIVVGIALASVRTNHPLPVYLVVGVVVAFAGFVYARLLGRLAWACQMGPPQKCRKKSARDDGAGD